MLSLSDKGRRGGLQRPCLYRFDLTGLICRITGQVPDRRRSFRLPRLSDLASMCLSKHSEYGYLRNGGPRIALAPKRVDSRATLAQLWNVAGCDRPAAFVKVGRADSAA